jgi:hypothetical protein
MTPNSSSWLESMGGNGLEALAFLTLHDHDMDALGRSIVAVQKSIETEKNSERQARNRSFYVIKSRRG